jgi:hypothetical protein
MKDEISNTIAYKNSIAYTTVMGCTNEQLINRVRYTKMAIGFHTIKNDIEQVMFFTEELNLINKRLNK